MFNIFNYGKSTTTLNNIEYETGDILLFNGNGFFGKLVERCTKSKYSHIGMILKNPTYINSKYIGDYFIESVLNYNDVTKKFICGIYVSPLSEVLQLCKENNCKVYCRKLQNFICDRDVCINLNLSYNKIKNIPYDLNPIDWVYAKESVDDKNIDKYMEDHKLDYEEFQKTKALWCSALVGYLYTKMNILSKYTPWNLLAPVDFAPEGEDNLKFINNCSLSKNLIQIL